MRPLRCISPPFLVLWLISASTDAQFSLKDIKKAADKALDVAQEVDRFTFEEIDPSGNDTVDFSPASQGVTFDMDVFGFSQSTDLIFDVIPPEIDAPQDVFGDGSATV